MLHIMKCRSRDCLQLIINEWKKLNLRRECFKMWYITEKQFNKYLHFQENVYVQSGKQLWLFLVYNDVLIVYIYTP